MSKGGAAETVRLAFAGRNLSPTEDRLAEMGDEAETSWSLWTVD